MFFKNARYTSLIAGIIIELCVGIGDAWSVFQNPLMEKFGWTTAAISITFTIMTVLSVAAPLVAKLQDYFKTRNIVLVGSLFYGGGLVATGFISSITGLYITYGLGVGIGVSMIYPLVIGYMVRTYPEKKGLVSGIMVASYASGAMIWAPVGAHLTTAFGILSAFKFLGVGLMIVIIIATRFLKHTPIANVRHSHANAGVLGNMGWREMLATPIFYILFLVVMIGTTSGLMIIAHASPMIQTNMNVSPEKAAFFVGILAAANAFGRLFWGGLSDRTGRFPLLILLFILCIGAFFTLSCSPAPILFLIAIVVIQSSFGGHMCLMAPINADIFGTRYLGINYGITFMAYSSSGIIGPRLAAVIKEANNGDYRQAYLIAMYLCVVGLFLAITAAFKYRRFSVRQLESEASGEKLDGRMVSEVS
jgi:OFA family oxalate/formate antiporter-like MFS transporter